MRHRNAIAALTGALVFVTALAAVAQTRRTDAPRPASEGVVNINTASAEQLALLPGVGPSRAQAIIQARQGRPFRAVRELQRVRGIGWTTVQRLRPYLSVSGETTLREPVPMPSKRGGR